MTPTEDELVRKLQAKFRGNLERKKLRMANSVAESYAVPVEAALAVSAFRFSRAMQTKETNAISLLKTRRKMGVLDADGRDRAAVAESRRVKPPSVFGSSHSTLPPPLLESSDGGTAGFARHRAFPPKTTGVAVDMSGGMTSGGRPPTGGNVPLTPQRVGDRHTLVVAVGGQNRRALQQAAVATVPGFNTLGSNGRRLPTPPLTPGTPGQSVGRGRPALRGLMHGRQAAGRPTARRLLPPAPAASGGAVALVPPRPPPPPSYLRVLRKRLYPTAPDATMPGTASRQDGGEDEISAAESVGASGWAERPLLSASVAWADGDSAGPRADGEIEEPLELPVPEEATGAKVLRLVVKTQAKFRGIKARMEVRFH